jgi:hypothetical protein
MPEHGLEECCCWVLEGVCYGEEVEFFIENGMYYFPGGLVVVEAVKEESESKWRQGSFF